MAKPGRNDPCHCGSGKKYKKCCQPKDDEAERQAIAQQQAAREERAEARRVQLAEERALDVTGMSFHVRCGQRARA